MPTKYNKLTRASDAYNEHNDCAVWALATATGIGYDKAHTFLKANGRKDRGRTYRYISEAAVKEAGFKIEKRNWYWDYPTVRTLERELMKNMKGRKFMIFIRGHVMGFDGEEIVDWAAGRLHKVTEIWEIIPPKPKAKVVPLVPVNHNYELDLGFALEAA